tara:strand:+ start:21601 stop:22431 length:831 start_codon:yes stop_codon:yes gene_type:complete
MNLSSIKIDLLKKVLHNRLSNINTEDDYKNLIIGLLSKPKTSHTWGNTKYSKAQGIKNGHFLNLEYEFKSKNSFRIAREIFSEISNLSNNDNRIQLEYDQDNNKINVVYHNNKVVKSENKNKKKDIEKNTDQDISKYIKSIKYSSFLSMTRLGIFTLHKNNSLKKNLDKKDINNAINEYKINSRDNIGDGYQKGISMFVAYGHAFYNKSINSYLKKNENELFQILKQESGDILKMAFQQHPEQKSLYLEEKISNDKNIQDNITKKLIKQKTLNKIY